MNNKRWEEVKFEPWTGCRYGSENSLGLPKRLLVLGESHYGGEVRPTFTQYVVEEVIGGRGRALPFFKRLFNASCGAKKKPTREALEEFCHAIAFYNFIQTMMETPGDPSKHACWGAAEGPFFECLDRLKPSHIVTCGFTLWRNLPGKRFSRLRRETERDFFDQLPDRGRSRWDRRCRGDDWIGRYGHSGGSCFSLRILHPSSIGKHFFWPDEWQPVLQRFFEL